MSITPGEVPGAREEPILADEPAPPGVEDWSDDVDAMEERIRKGGPDEVEEADEAADAVEGHGEHEDGSQDRAAADSDQDPTDDGLGNEPPD
ncbi:MULTISPECIES: hypothetical protein [unclassified Ornithinimicrobium]|uniref:hypothetical protein n=1 Tax=unclassified Ornithinimicrobium TaxID=2615080 RepID=UPI003854A9F7